MAFNSFICLEVTENYLGSQLADLDNFFKLHSIYKATQEDNLKVLEASLEDFAAVRYQIIY